MDYQFKDIEQKWQQFWAANQTFKADNHSAKPKYYVLDMFPYPSGAGLHVGHPLGYIASDIFSRYKRLKGFNVLHPMGYDSFGLPAEQYAIQTGQHPAITTETNIATYRRQLDQIGFSFDWSREVRTSSPDYYKWTQWIFMQLFNSWYNKDADKAESINILVAHFEQNGSAGINAVCDEEVTGFTAAEWKAKTIEEQQIELLKYRLTYLRESTVNWCPALGTVLANDEVKDGFSERGGYPVEQKKMRQWSMRITAYAERLLQGLDTIDWPEPLKEMQRNWIGKSMGASVRFSLTPALSKGEGVKIQGFETADPTKWELLKSNSRSNRQTPTEAENILWQQLRNSQIGYKIRRQHPIDSYIADFACLGKGLVIEIDGGYHNNEITKEDDAFRTSVLNDKGFDVIRFTNDEVIRNSQKVIEEIKATLDKQPDRKVLSSGEDLGEAPGFIEVFTTRVDTIFGVTFLVIAPEHELVAELTTPGQKLSVDTYIAQTKKKSELDRMADTKTVSGAFTGSYATNPLNGELIPIWIADYVLAGYGTGAVMAVPSGDQRDYLFAKHFSLPIVPIIDLQNIETEADPTKEGKYINSDFVNGLTYKNATAAIIAKLEETGAGKAKINYRMRDAIFGRQRYWGEPVPVYFKGDLPYLISEKELPLLLPEVDRYLPTETGEPPLARAEGWSYKTAGQPHPNPPREGGLQEKGEDVRVYRETADPVYYEQLKEFSRANRSQPTTAESILWQLLRNNQTGYKIRRQHAIGQFIADFVSLEKGLIIELDGNHHILNKEADDRRTDILNHLGFMVIRFSNDEIMQNPQNVAETIKAKLEKLPERAAKVSPPGGDLEGADDRPHPTLPGREGFMKAAKVSPSGGDLEGASYPYELSTMPGWAGSSWYWYRYMDAHNDEEFASKAAIAYWKDVDLYIGGSEHATGHLLYSRFWNKFMKDLDLVIEEEPFKKLINQGMIQGRSNFVYRAFLDIIPKKENYSYIEEQSAHNTIELPPIYISYDKLQDVVTDTESRRNIIDFLKIRLSDELAKKEVTISYEVFRIGRIPVDVNIVHNDILDIDKFKAWRPELENAIFVFGNKGNDYVCGWEVEKMSKSKFNVVNPDDLITRYGADTLRMYEMFLGPLEQSKPWNTNGIEGAFKFLRKFWRLFHDGDWNFTVLDAEPTKAELKSLHKIIHKVEEDVERFSFNTSVSSFMIAVNELTDLKCNKRAILQDLVIILSPYAPHICEELWVLLGNEAGTLSYAAYPKYNPAYMVEDEFAYPISINGKTKTNINISLSMDAPAVEAFVLDNAEVQKYLAGSAPKKVIVVKGRIVNIVA